MKWEPSEPKETDYFLASGMFKISRPGKPETVPLPYGLWFNGQLIRHFETSKEAMQEAENMTVAQI